MMTEERYAGELASQLVAMTEWGVKPAEAPEQREALLQRLRAPDGNGNEPDAMTTVDFILSTHRVWLGTGGVPI